MRRVLLALVLVAGCSHPPPPPPDTFQDCNDGMEKVHQALLDAHVLTLTAETDKTWVLIQKLYAACRRIPHEEPVSLP